MVPCPVQHWALETPHQVALVFEDQSWTWSQLNKAVTRVQCGLTALGIHLGDRVALVSNNHPQLVFLHAALARLGAAAVPINTRLTAPEQDAQRARCHPRFVWRQGDALPDAPGTANADLRNNSVAAVLFTSGTTGLPKGAQLTVGNFAAAARANAGNLGDASSQRWLCTLPLFHVGGLAMLWRCLHAGMRLHLEARFDVGRVAHALDHDGITHLSLVPTTLARLLDLRGGTPCARTITALVGGGPVQDTRLTQARALNMVALQTYGLTEATSQVCTQRPDDPSADHAGPPLPGLQVRVVGDQDTEVPAGTPGLVQVMGPTVMAGYLDDEAATRAVMHGLWLRTGDLGWVGTDGALRILSRRTDLVIRGGENVYPAEVEHVLLQMENMVECVVLPAADAHWGQVPVAFVCTRNTLTAQHMGAFVGARLAAFKVPARFVELPDLPRNAMGKVDRPALLALLG